ncbi:MAG: flagellar basal-body rod protein FlgG, partial [Spirochaetaceae bacterium]|nr:flagellar basal-body rod protein FlgG [Spirochaetaceae bacterium]
MMRSLWTAATGMHAQQFNIDTISNNLSNVNTNGYKQVRAEFEDLIYLNSRIAGTPATERTVTPTGIQVGHGVRVGASQRMFSQGSLKQTDAIGDMAVMGEGFFRVLNMDGTLGYTRDGSFKIDANGQFVSSNGYRLMPELILPENFIPESLAVSQQGKVTVKIPGNDIPVDVGQVDLYRFINNAGLQAIGENLYMETPASGDALRGVPGQEGMGKVYHKFLENSNVSVVKEMVGMIVAQRAYELNSKAIQTSDSMLGTANN